MGVQFVQMRPDDRAKVNQYMSRRDVTEAAVAAIRDKIEEFTSPTAPLSQLAISRRSERGDELRFERELSHLVELTGKGTYYQLLEVTSESSSSQVKKSYYALARKFHPDRLGGNQALLAQI